ncbi:MAG: plastocyanin/azurin family copper-binding protein [Nitrososphaeraceae archaeon]|jgi:amicyanin
MSIKYKVAIFSVLAVLALAVMSGTSTIVVVGSVSAQDSTEQQSSEAGSNGTANSGNSTSSTVAGTKVSIVEEASEMGDQAYDPNPVNVKAGDTVTWTNDDSQIHTVTSGTDSSDPNMEKEFDSSMLSQNQTFSHKFNTAGEFPYFCQLHPTMVGKVIVVS